MSLWRLPPAVQVEREPRIEGVLGGQMPIGYKIPPAESGGPENIARVIFFVDDVVLVEVQLFEDGRRRLALLKSLRGGGGAGTSRGTCARAQENDCVCNGIRSVGSLGGHRVYDDVLATAEGDRSRGTAEGVATGA